MNSDEHLMGRHAASDGTVPLIETRRPVARKTLVLHSLFLFWGKRNGFLLTQQVDPFGEAIGPN